MYYPFISCSIYQAADIEVSFSVGFGAPSDVSDAALASAQEGISSSVSQSIGSQLGTNATQPETKVVGFHEVSRRRQLAASNSTRNFVVDLAVVVPLGPVAPIFRSSILGNVGNFLAQVTVGQLLQSFIASNASSVAGLTVASASSTLPLSSVLINVVVGKASPSPSVLPVMGSSASLSVGTWVGIGVGIFACVIAVCILALLFFLPILGGKKSEKRPDLLKLSLSLAPLVIELAKKKMMPAWQ